MAIPLGLAIFAAIVGFPVLMTVQIFTAEDPPIVGSPHGSAQAGETPTMDGLAFLLGILFLGPLGLLVSLVLLGALVAVTGIQPSPRMPRREEFREQYHL